MSALISKALERNLKKDSGAGRVGFDGGTVQDVLDSAKPMQSYEELDEYAGRAIAVRITTPGIHGFFRREDADTTTPASGVCRVDALGRRWTRLIDGEVNVQWFIPAGTNTAITNCAPFIQLATDYAESIKTVLKFDGARTYLIASNLYIGNAIWQTNGATFSVLSNDGFTQVGTGTAKNEGVILTKSTGGGGYGLTTIDFLADELRVLFSRPVNGVGPKTAILLQNVSAFNVSLVDIKTADGQDSAKCPLDFYRGCQNVNIETLRLYIRNGIRAESVWIRNDSALRPTCNVNIGLLDIDFEGIDEAIAIYPFLNSGADVFGVNIDVANIKTQGASQGVSFIDLSGTPYSDMRMKGIKIGVLNLEFASSRANAFGVKAENCAPRIDECNINVNSLAGASGNVFLIRAVSAVGQNNRFSFGRANLTTIVTAPAGTTFIGIGGLVELDVANIYTSGAGSYTRMIDGIQSIERGNLIGQTSAFAVRNTRRLGRGVLVRGKTEGLVEFYGRLIVDTNAFSGAAWILHTSATMEPTARIIIDCEVEIIGAGTLTHVFNANAAWASDKPVSLAMRVKNLGGLAMPSDFVGGSYKLTSYDVVITNSSATTRRAAPATVL